MVMIRKLTTLHILTLVLFCFAFLPQPAFAAVCNSGSVKSFKDSANMCLNGTPTEETDNTGPLMKVIQDVISTLLFAAGVAAVVVLVLGGFRFVTSEGDANKASQAKRTIFYAVIGLVVAASAYTVVAFVTNQL
jgi:Type IV secretion system pilin